MKKKNLIGKIFGRLTVISEKTISPPKDTRAYWSCRCECGNIIIVSTNHLTSKNTKSCGCLKTEAIRKNQKLSLPTIRKYEPNIASARRLWQQYRYQDKQCNLSFEQWFNLSQKNCFYCGIAPYSNYNYFITKKEASQYAKDAGYFTYNGLDRFNNSLPHTLENVVPCCSICNRAKSDRTIQEFYQYISNLKISAPIYSKTLSLPSGYSLVSVKGVYRHYVKNYDGMEIDLQTFYTYSQQPCFYCGTQKSNYFNVYLKDKKSSNIAKEGAHFHYNGIDRLDNTKFHTIDNIVPCCHYCNFAKNKLSLSEFQSWIKRVQLYQQNNATKLGCSPQR